MTQAQSIIPAVANGPLFSVVIPTFNRAKKVVRAVRSVLSQTFPDFEICVVDDGSSDETGSALAALDISRLKYIYQSNQGVAAARNAGLALADGVYVAFLDADDWWYADKLSRVAKAIQTNPEAGLFYSGMDVVDRLGNAVRTVRARRARGDAYRDLLEGNYVFTSGAVAKRLCIKSVGGFDHKLEPCEDWDLWIRIARNYPISRIPEVSVAIEASGDDSLTSRYEKWASAHDQVMAKALAADADLTLTWMSRIAAGVSYAKASIYLGAGEERLALEQFKRAFMQNARRWRALVYVIVLSWTALRRSLPNRAKVLLRLPEAHR
jgi:glycosyltransferase involved in cell wall biosynthesis